MAAPHLIQVLRQRPAAPARADERCELCGESLYDEHGHLVNIVDRTLLCVCRGCQLLFEHVGSGGARFRSVPRRYVWLSESAGAAEANVAWDALQMPIGLAFFFRNSLTGRLTAFYPSPAGATESELPLDAWQDLTRAVPQLATVADDVEAVLIRTRDTTTDALIAPIDACYELVGRIRRLWRGFQGGDAVWREIDDFFDRAHRQAMESSA